MSYSYVQYQGDGSTSLYLVPFLYIDRSHISVKVAGDPVTFEWASDTTILILPAPSGVVEIRRSTPKTASPVDFVDGSVLREKDLDLLATFSLFCAQEAQDAADAAIAQSSLGIALGLIYQGVRATPPTIRTNGDAIVVGDMYFDSDEMTLKVYTGLLWQDAGATVPGILNKPTAPIIATAGQTVVPIPGGFDPTGLIVFVNGVSISPSDINISSGTNVVFTEAFVGGEEITWLSFGVFEVAGTVSKAELASASGSGLSGFKQAGANTVLRTIETELRETLKASQFTGVDATGVTGSSAGFANAVTAAAGKKLVAVGTFLIDATVDLASDTVYDFTGATFVFKCNTYGFRVKNKTKVKIIGGKYSPHSTVVTATHPTGTYGNLDAFHFEDSTECSLLFGRFSNFYGAVNFYNCSDCTAAYNELTDNAGGIQLLASSSISSNWACRGIDFSHNRVLHSGDDGLSFLIGTGYSGTISASKIIGNHVTKTVGAKGTVGQARGIALVSEPTTGSNNIHGVLVAGNTGYYMHQGFIRATGVIRSKIVHNAVDSYAQAGSSYAYAFGDTSTGAYGVVDCLFADNSATNPLTTSKAFVTDGALRCKFKDNYAIVSIGGEGTIRVDNANACFFEGNTFHNTSAYAMQLTATSQYCQIKNNDFSVFSVVAIADSGTANNKDNNFGHVNRNGAQASISGTNTAVVVNHGVFLNSASRLRVRLTPLENWFNSTKVWVNGYTTSQFTINVSPAPGAGNTIYFEWEAYESPS